MNSVVYCKKYNSVDAESQDTGLYCLPRPVCIDHESQIVFKFKVFTVDGF